jgi:hypothetical protein
MNNLIPTIIFDAPVPLYISLAIMPELVKTPAVKQTIKRHHGFWQNVCTVKCGAARGTYALTHYPNRIQFIDIEIKLDTEEAIERLKGIPGGAETAIRSAIRSGLAKAKTAIVASIKKSFTTPLSYIRKAIGTPRYSGIGAALTGRLEIKRSRLPIRIFPHRQLPDAGGAIFGTDPPLRVFGGGHPAQRSPSIRPQSRMSFSWNAVFQSHSGNPLGRQPVTDLRAFKIDGKNPVATTWKHDYRGISTLAYVPATAVSHASPRKNLKTQTRHREQRSKTSS